MVAKVGAKVAPATGSWRTPLSVAGISTPQTSRIVAATSIACRKWGRIPPGSTMPGADTMSGSAMPPSCVSRFQRRNGVFPAIAQPQE